MSKMLDEATDAVRCLSVDEQDEIVRKIRSLALEAQGFKLVPGGYAFRVSSPWMFGRADHYLVTDAQIKEIADARNTKSDMMLAVLVAAIPSAVLSWAAVALAPELAVGRVLFWLGIGGATVLVNVQCFRWLAFRRLRPILVRLPGTKE